MITTLNVLNSVESGWIALAITIISLVISFLFFISFKENRDKKVILKYLFKLFVVLEICDLIWFLCFFPNGEYFNYGLGGGVILLLLPLILTCINVVIITRRKNKDNDKNE